MSEEKDEERRRWRHERGTSGLFWGLVLILLGVVFLLSSQGWLPRGEWWHYFLIGLGLIFLIESLMRYCRQQNRRSGFGRVFTGLVLVLVGLAFLLGFGEWWPLILIVVGLAMVLRVWLRR